jgi:hypothetical protein
MNEEVTTRYPLLVHEGYVFKVSGQFDIFDSVNQYQENYILNLPSVQAEPLVVSKEAHWAETIDVAILDALLNSEDRPLDVLRWLDRMLIRLCQKFVDYKKSGLASDQWITLTFILNPCPIFVEVNSLTVQTKRLSIGE